MTNEELRQAIADANHMLRQTSKDARNYADRLASTGPPCGLRCKRQFGFTGCQKPQH